jgi:ankyrin repeat protein
VCSLTERQLDARANLGLTALHYAAGNGAAEALQLLLNVRAPFLFRFFLDIFVVPNISHTFQFV